MTKLGFINLNILTKYIVLLHACLVIKLLEHQILKIGLSRIWGPPILRSKICGTMGLAFTLSITGK